MGPQSVMNCPHCNENIAVRLEKPGRKAARRRLLRARRALRLSELRSEEPSTTEEEFGPTEMRSAPEEEE